jgi:peptide/nickel transport system permease protein/nickel transport system permease protein
VVESVFSLSGLGSYLMACVVAADATAVSTCIVIIAAVFVLANLAGDIINRLLCPWMVRETHA